MKCESSLAEEQGAKSLEEELIYRACCLPADDGFSQTSGMRPTSGGVCCPAALLMPSSVSHGMNHARGIEDLAAMEWNNGSSTRDEDTH
jgi:hypothetical protein